MTAEQAHAPFTDYSLFGLRVRSMLSLPELFPATGDADCDVSIVTGAIDHPPAGTALLAVSEGMLLEIADVGRFLISGGNRILVEAEPGGDPRNLRLFLLGSAFGALIHQRGLLPLHANAVNVDGMAVAFMGPSGAGKSTLATWFHDTGHAVLADDVCVVRFDESGRALALPGLPRLRLWRDALDFTGRPADLLHRSYAGEDAHFEKFDVPIAEANAGNAEIPLLAACVLERGDSFSMTRLTGLDAARAIFENTYRGAFLHAASAQHAHWESAMRLVQSTPVFRVERRWDLEMLEEQGTAMLEQLRSLVEPQLNSSR